MRISVKVQPRSSVEKVVMVREGEYKVHVHAAAVDGKANVAAIGMLADFFGMKKNRLRIVSGERSRNKIIEIKKEP